MLVDVVLSDVVKSGSCVVLSFDDGVVLKAAIVMTMIHGNKYFFELEN